MFYISKFKLGKTIVFLFFILLSLIFVKNAQAATHYHCTPVTNLGGIPFDSSISLSWSRPSLHNDDNGSDDYSRITVSLPYLINWSRLGFTGMDTTTIPATCPTGSLTADCGSASTSTNVLYPSLITVLIPGLTNGQSYSFSVGYNGCPYGNNTVGTNTVVAAGTDPIWNYTGATPGFCGDGIAETVNGEQCDGLNLNSKTCSTAGSFDSGGILSCTNLCTFNTSQCIACNNIYSPTMSNGVNNQSLVGAGSTFTCFVPADHLGNAVLCQVRSNAGGTTISDCRFDSWQGITATFNCTAPTTVSSRANPYVLYSSYPALSSSNSSGIVSASNCPPQGKVSTQYLTVVAADNTPPVVSITESYSNYLNENPQTVLSINVYCSDTGGSGCDDSSPNSTLKLKRFDTKPTSCPTNYSDYNLTSPNFPALSKTAWFCGAAKDNLGNIGFSPVTEVRPGCRDQCKAQDDHVCVIGNTTATSYNCGNFDTDACLEDQAGSTCHYNACITPPGYCYGLKSNNTIDDYVRLAKVFDQAGAPIQGIKVYVGNSGESGAFTTDSNGYARLLTSTQGLFNSNVVVPPGWQFSSASCNNISTASNSCSISIDNTSAANNLTESFTISLTDTTPPVISFSRSPAATINSGGLASFTADATDNVGVSKILIYIDGGLTKRCDFDLYIAGNRSCSYDTTALPAGSHTFYAEGYDNVGNKATSSLGTFTVTSSSGSGGGTGGSGTGSGGSSGTPPSASLPARANGLVSTPSLTPTGSFPTSGASVIDPKAAFAPFDIPTFDDLKSLYYDQKR